MTFKDYINEGIIDKGINWLINNTKTFEELYINTQKNYGAKTILVKSPVDNIKFIKEKNSYAYFIVNTGKKELICIMKDEQTEDMKDYISDNAPVNLTIVSLPKMENNGITPFFIKKIRDV